MENCIFCKIVDKKIPADIIYEDDDVLAFKDINPAAPVHFLIIPKFHLPSLADAKLEHAQILGKLLGLAPKLAIQEGCDLKTLPNGNVTGGFKTQINTGPDGGQEVYHLHLHVIGGARPWRGQ